MKNIELIDKAVDSTKGLWREGSDILLRMGAGGLAFASFDGKHYRLNDQVILDPDLWEVLCTRAEFEARKAERQNKPDWKDAPDWAQYLAQNNIGAWWWYPQHQNRPKEGVGCFQNKAKDCCEKAGNGEVVGCWQDTLEQRPAMTLAKGGPLVVENCHAIIHNYQIGVHVSADDEHDWHARGELPPAGTECLCWFDDGRECWHECIVIGSIDSEIKNRYVAVSLIGKHDRKLVWANEFRPLRTEREKFIDAAMSTAGDYHKLEDILGDLFDAGFRAPDQK